MHNGGTLPERGDLVKKKTLFLTLLLLPFFMANPVASIVGSLSGSVLTVPSSVEPEGTASMLVYVGNATDPVAGATVTLSVTNGSFTALVSGIPAVPFVPGDIVEAETNSTGYVEVTWQAPVLGFQIPSISVMVTADIFYAPEELALTLQDTVTVEHSGLEDLSQINANISSTVLAGTEVPIEVFVGDSLGNPTPNAQVTLQIPDGNFSQSGSDQIQGFTNSEGKFVALWKAPLLPPETPVVNSSLTVLAELSPLLNRTVSFPFDIVLSDSESLFVSYLGPGEVDEETVSQLVFNVQNSNGSVDGAELLITSTRGFFLQNGSFLDTEILSIANSSGYAEVTWKAPTLDGNVPETATINVLLQLGFNSKEFSFDINIDPVLMKVQVNWTSSLEGWLQNETIPVQVRVTEVNSSTPVEGVSILFSTDTGEWNTTSSDAMTAVTDEGGNAKAFLDVSNVIFEFEFNEINVLATVSGSKVEDTGANATLIVQRVLTLPTGNSSISSAIVKAGENVSIEVEALLNGIPSAGLTIELIATGGSFPASASGIPEVLRLLTDTDGKAKALWVAPQTSSNSTVFITVNIVYNGETVRVNLHEITVVGSSTVEETSPSATLDLSDTSNRQTQLVGALAGTAAIIGGATAVIIVIRKSKK